MGISSVGLILIVVLGVPLGIALLVYLIVPAFKGFAWLISQVFRFIFGELGDILRVIGGIVTTLVLIPITVANVLIGRWSGASHYGRAIQAEGRALGAAFYRIVVGHPARLFCLTALTEGIEKRIPAVVAAAPGSDRPAGRAGQFAGYEIVGSLAGGGSGGKLYIANPTAEKRAALDRAGVADVGQVVIKCFSLRDGSSLPQIVRENRALPAAKRMGLILEHELTEERFFYVMKYVPGESLGLVTQRLHAQSGSDGLAPRPLREALEYAADLVRTLHHYHQGGLWHKDVKPDNIIVAGGQAHLVDFGLITPLRSSLTLTTHGTEYFRDPEMVRLALRGVKVHEVDGAKFDIYAAGAVIYSMIENSFPAHGGLSQITRRCPEAVRWIVRRAMTDYDKRYESAATLLADLDAVLAAPDPFAIKPAGLPSFSPTHDQPAPAKPHEWEAAMPAAMAGAAALPGWAAGPRASYSPPAPQFATPAHANTPRLRVTNWWTGRYSVEPSHAAPAAFAPPQRVVHRGDRVPGATAAAQLARARERARTARARAHARMRRYSPDTFKPINAGVGLAVLAFLLLVGGVVFVIGSIGGQRAVTITQHNDDGDRIVHFGPDGVRISSGRSLRSPEVPAVAAAPAAPTAPVPPLPRFTFDRVSGVEIPLPPPVEPRGQAMVLRDSVTFTSSAKPDIDLQVAGLRDAGFTLRGNAFSPGEQTIDDAVETELVADLRNQIGVATFGTAAAAEAIRGWLDRHAEIPLVVWIGRADDAEPEAWIVGRNGPDDGLVRIAASAIAATETVRR